MLDLLKRFVCSLLTASVCLAAGSASAVSAGCDADGISAVIENIISYKENKLGVSTKAELIGAIAENAGGYENQWYLTALSKYGVEVSTSSVRSALTEAALALYDGNSKATDFERVILTFAACGLDPTDAKGHNLLADGVYNSDKAISQGINAYCYALIALDCGSFSVPNGAKHSRSDFIELILECQLSDGGFALTGTRADPDVTAICVQALAPYVGESEVLAAVDKAVECLSEMQNSDGGFSSYGSKNAESCAQVLSALIALDIDPESDSRFIKNGGSTVDALLSFQNPDGGFAHLESGPSNSIATYQALNALADYYCFIKYGETEIFAFTQPSAASKGSSSSASKNTSGGSATALSQSTAQPPSSARTQGGSDGTYPQSSEVSGQSSASAGDEASTAQTEEAAAVSSEASETVKEDKDAASADGYATTAASTDTALTDWNLNTPAQTESALAALLIVSGVLAAGCILSAVLIRSRKAEIASDDPE